MKLANEMIEHMEAEPCVEDLKSEIERLKRENETLRENYIKDVGEASAGAHIGVLALSALNMVKAVLSVGKMPTAEMLKVMTASTANDLYGAFSEEAGVCLKNEGSCSFVVPMKHLILNLLRKNISCDAVGAVKMGLAGVNTGEEAIKILDSLPSHNCQIL